MGRGSFPKTLTLKIIGENYSNPFPRVKTKIRVICSCLTSNPIYIEVLIILSRLVGGMASFLLKSKYIKNSFVTYLKK